MTADGSVVGWQYHFQFAGSKGHPCFVLHGRKKKEKSKAPVQE
jgi:hypothetical protein